jgi:hypothetical protein
MTDEQKLAGAINALILHQRALDEYGVSVGVSREALDVVLLHLADRAPITPTADEWEGPLTEKVMM